MDDGGPAFPVVKVSFNTADNTIKANEANGMTLRDYFAAKAIPSLIRQIGYGETLETAVSKAYQIADILLQQRER